TKELEQHIREYVSEDKQQIEQLKAGMEQIPIEQREDVWNQIDKIESEIVEKYKQVLDDVLPVAFSIVKETAKRFTENAEIVVAATDF
ncbi:MAG TPA: hypothetical protein DEF88_00260, partial [Porphyromonadaceae bacterium]|nr:hypothetical protein [Porphyromonadaceae bacterium]